MSRLLLLFLFVILLFSCLVQGFVPCSNPKGHLHHYVGRNQECAALVQTSCHRAGGASIGLTSSWKRGEHVKQNCQKIPTLTAIATFLGPNHRYDEPHLHQHTAIFVKCEATGIRVYDQWNGTPIDYRIIPWKGHSVQYSGDNFYTVA